jgi:hypothetical protein
MRDEYLLERLLYSNHGSTTPHRDRTAGDGRMQRCWSFIPTEAAPKRPERSFVPLLSIID